MWRCFRMQPDLCVGLCCAALIRFGAAEQTTSRHAPNADPDGNIAAELVTAWSVSTATMWTAAQ